MRSINPNGITVWLMIAFFASMVVGADAQEWTRFRGPNGSGVAKAENLPVKWTEKDYNWRVELPGVGNSSPVLWGDRIFITSGDAKTAQRFVLCLKTSDGSVLWKRDYPSKAFTMHVFNSYASSTPAVDEARVYVFFAGEKEVTLLALTHDGKDVWQRTFETNKGEHGGAVSPIVFEELVILGGYRGEYKCSLLALDRKTGKNAWEIERRDDAVDYRAPYSTPFVYQPEGGAPQIVFCDNWSRGLTSVDPKTGRALWQARNALPGRSVASPILASGLIVAACGGSESPLQVSAVAPPAAISADTKAADTKAPDLKNADAKNTGTKNEDAKIPDAKVVWTYKQAPPYVPTPIAKGDLIFLWNDGGAVTCVRAKTGEKVWRETVGPNFLGSPVLVGERLYCISRPGEVFVIAAGEKYELLGRNHLGEVSQSTPAVAGGVLYLRTVSHLISIGGKK